MMVMMMPRRPLIRSRLRIEGCLDRLDMTAESFDHLLDHMVGADTDPIAEQLDGKVAVAQMPCDPHKLALVMRVDFQQWLGPRAHADDPTAIQRQAIAVAQTDGLWEVEQNLVPRLSHQDDTAAVAAVEVDQDFIRRIRPLSRGQNGGDPDQ
jgi:hypothetical protein